MGIIQTCPLSKSAGAGKSNKQELTCVAQTTCEASYHSGMEELTEWLKLFKDYENLGTRIFNIDDLAIMLELPKSYQNYTNFYNYVITPAIKEINAKSDIWVHEPEILQKHGKRISRIRFVFGKKSSAKWKKCDRCGYVSKVEIQSKAEKLIAQTLDKQTK